MSGGGGLGKPECEQCAIAGTGPPQLCVATYTVSGGPPCGRRRRRLSARAMRATRGSGVSDCLCMSRCGITALQGVRYAVAEQELHVR